MRVKELVAKLSEMDPEAEVYVYTGDNGPSWPGYQTDGVDGDSWMIGIATPTPVREQIVVISPN